MRVGDVASRSPKPRTAGSAISPTKRKPSKSKREKDRKDVEERKRKEAAVLPELRIGKEMLFSNDAAFCQLVAATVENDRDRIRFLLQMRALRHIVNRKLEMTMEDGMTGMFAPIDVAAIKGNLDAVQALILYGRAVIEPTVRHTPLDMTKEKQIKLQGPNPLYFACMYGHIAVAKWLVKKGAKADTKRAKTGFCALTMSVSRACQTQEYEERKQLLGVIDWLLTETNADVEAVMPKTEVNTLYHACRFGDVDVARILLFHSADTAFTQEGLREDEFSPLACAASSGNVHLLGILITEGDADVNQRCMETDATVLHIAAAKGHLMTCEWLVLECGADPLDVDIQGRRPIHIACEHGHEEVVFWLISSGTNVNLENTITGQTPIHIAAECGHASIVQHLVEEFGAAVNCRLKHPRTGRRDQGPTPIHCAIENGHLEIVVWLIENGGVQLDLKAEYKINLMDAMESDKSENGTTALMTPLFLAVCQALQPSFSSLIDAVRMCMGSAPKQGHRKKYSDADSADSISGQTPLMFATQHGRYDIVRILTTGRASANPNKRDSKNDWPPWLFCCQLGYLSILRYYIEECAIDRCVEEFKKRHCSPLYVARSNGQGEIASYLAEKYGEDKDDHENKEKLGAAGAMHQVADSLNIISL